MAENYVNEFIKQYEESNISLDKDYITDYIYNAISDDAIAYHVVGESLELLNKKYNLDLNQHLKI